MSIIAPQPHRKFDAIDRHNGRVYGIGRFAVENGWAHSDSDEVDEPVPVQTLWVEAHSVTTDDLLYITKRTTITVLKVRRVFKHVHIEGSDDGGVQVKARFPRNHMVKVARIPKPGEPLVPAVAVAGPRSTNGKLFVVQPR